ncbi:hypothetical protein RJ640_008303, partial [Escallonia rubra]
LHAILCNTQSSQNGSSEFQVGVVLDLDSPVGSTGLTYLSMALSDFYSAHRNYTTKLVLHVSDSRGNVIDAATSALSLLKDERVDAIIGPQKSVQANFVMDLGERAHVPIISFSATSPSLLPQPPNYFLQTAQSDDTQVGAIAAIIKSFQWKDIVMIFEDTVYGKGIVPYLANALQDIDARFSYRSVFPLSASDDFILKELYKMMTMQTRVFVVQMSHSLAARLFLNAKEIGMMNKGYAWILTSGLMDIYTSMEPNVKEAMQGVLGVKHQIPQPVKQGKTSIVGIWAYDTLWALAMAAEKVGVKEPVAFDTTSTMNSTNVFSFETSQTGPKLLKAMLETWFKGLGGDFRLVKGRVVPSPFQIINVVEKEEKEIGIWTPSQGISWVTSNSTSTKNLRGIIWPGESNDVPKGWEVPTSGKKLRIGVPVKSSFTEFVKVDWDPLTNLPEVSGYVIEVFESVMKALPYAVPYEYIPFVKTDYTSGGSYYNDLVYQVYLQKLDAAAGDITITANRSLYVDFTLPYAEGGVSMVVPVSYEDVNNKWTFLKPLRRDLWVTSIGFFILTGFAVWVLEHRINVAFRGPPSQHVGMMLWFPFSTLVFAHREKILSNFARLVVVVWVFVVLILSSSYTASLSSRLTVQRFHTTVTELQDLIKNRDRVGHAEGSFVADLLIHLGFNRSNLRSCKSAEECNEALSNGSQNDGISAFFGTTPHINFFLSKYCKKYMKVGPTYPTDGYAFVSDSPLSTSSIISLHANLCNTKSSQNGSSEFQVGVVLDLDSPVGSTGLTYLSMAHSDFYSAHSNYTTKLVLHVSDSRGNVIDAATSALSLLKDERVDAIIGPQKSEQANFVMDLGERAHVPIISLSATSPSLLPQPPNYFLQTAQSDDTQVGAIAAIIKSFRWKHIVMIFEDTVYGKGIVPYLANALQDIDARIAYRSVFPLSASDDFILKELYKMMTMQTRVFVVQLSHSLAARLFLNAKEIGMMNKGYAWIMTSGLMDIYTSMEPNVKEAMQGVLGVKHQIPQPVKQGKTSVVGIWAYDTLWALAMAAEKVGVKEPVVFDTTSTMNSTNVFSFETSQTGPKLLKAMLETRFKGLGGDFRLVKGRVLPSPFQIINVVEKEEKEIGMWTLSQGISWKTSNSTSTKNLRGIIWPGESNDVPKGWEVPTSGKKLRIGVPVKSGFTEFVKVDWDARTNLAKVSGYAIDVFDSVMKELPYVVPYEYIPFENKTDYTNGGGYYNDLVSQVYRQEYDAAVGDITITAHRSLYVDFTLPYAEGGVSMVVPVSYEDGNNKWTFLKPLRSDLWVTSIGFFILTGFAIWVLEHRINVAFRGPPSQHVGMMLWFPFSTLVFAHNEDPLEWILIRSSIVGERILSNFARLVVVVWVFVVLILSSSYTASLSSRLTVQRFHPTVKEYHDLIKNQDKVGHAEGSFVADFLIHLGFNGSNLKSYKSAGECNEALINGSQNNGISAFFGTTPHVNFFLSKYCKKYVKVGPIHRTDGYAFVSDFPLFTSSIIGFESSVGSTNSAGGREPGSSGTPETTSVAGISTSIGIEADFYSAHSNYTTKLVLHVSDSRGNVIDAATSALSLLKDERVDAIIGPQKSEQANFVMDLGERAHVPIISFSATSPSLLPQPPNYFLQTAQSDDTQVGAIAAIIKSFQWKDIVMIFEDTVYGKGILPYLANALQDIDARFSYRSVFPLSASDDFILKELYKMMTMQTRVFVVQMSHSLAARLFLNAKEIGMMNKGYAWIMTSGLMDTSMKPNVKEAMQGVLGVKHQIPQPVKQGNTSIVGIWAYDTLWALAMAAEKVGVKAPVAFDTTSTMNSTNVFSFETSQTGPKLLKAMLETRFKGLGGDFRLVKGRVLPSPFQIINVVEKEEKEVGIWTPSQGISWETSNSTSTKNLRGIIWPGESNVVPKGWEVPTGGKKLRIGVPVKAGFTEFVKVDWDPRTNLPEVSGYAIDVFESVVKALPYAVPYEYVPFVKTDYTSGGSYYNDLVYQVYLQKFDAAVGDITITANRSLYVDFTLPYAEGGVAMVMPVSYEDVNNKWTFLKPLRRDLWVTSIGFFILTGFAVWVLEHRINVAFRGPPSQHVGMMLWFPFSTLVFAHRERILSNFARLVVVVWVFVVLILSSSYTASLSSRLTVQRLHPTVTEVEDLIKNRHYVGHAEGSFVGDLLIHLGFNRSNLKSYKSAEECSEALSNGSQNNGISAFFGTGPHINNFLSKYCDKYMKVGPTQRTDGYAFVFPRGSPLVSDVSRAVIKIIDNMAGYIPTCTGPENTVASNSISLESFAGLFGITGGVTVICLLLFLVIYLLKNRGLLQRSSLWSSLCAMCRHFDQRDVSSYPFSRNKDSQDLELQDISVSSHFGSSPALPRNSHSSDSRTEVEGRDVNDQTIHCSSEDTIIVHQ